MDGFGCIQIYLFVEAPKVAIAPESESQGDVHRTTALACFFDSSKQSLVSSIAKVRESGNAQRLRDTHATCYRFTRGSLLPLLQRNFKPDFTSRISCKLSPARPHFYAVPFTRLALPLPNSYISARTLPFPNTRTTRNTQSHKPPTMANNSSDSGHATTSSDSDSDRPRTPPPLAVAAPRSRANTARSFLTAPSKIPKLSTATSVSKVQAPVSPPRTPADRDTAPATLDWGSGGEWSALVGEIRKGAAEVVSEAVDDEDDDDEDGSPEEVSEEKEKSLSQSTMVSSGLFDDSEHTTAAPKRPFDYSQHKEVSDDDDDDDDEPLIVFEDIDQHKGEGEEEEVHGGVVLDAESFGATASQTSDLEQYDLHASSAFRERSTATESFDVLSDDEELPVVSVMKESEQRIVEQQGPQDTVKQETDLADADASQASASDSDMPTTSEPEQSGDTDPLERVGNDEQLLVASPSKVVDQHISKQQDLHETLPMQEMKLSDADVSRTSESDVSDMELPAAIIRGPFLNLMDREPTGEVHTTVSPGIVLQGLIRDTRPETIHFTLPHSSFSPDDLREGLWYAYNMLQVATTKLAMLELLDEETMSLTGADLRSWITLVDNSNPRAHAEPCISAIFEALSTAEMKAALEELVQSKRIVEAEVEKTQMSLLRKAVAKERQERIAVVPIKRAAHFDKECGSSSKKRRVSQEDNETALDAFLTAIMVLLIGVLYFCVRE